MLEQEFVYVGDEGIVEPSGRSRRLGLDLGMHYQATRHLFLNLDLNYAYARSIDEVEGADFIPLAPDFTAVGGISLQHPSGLSGNLQFRYLDQRPADEGNRIIAEGYFVTDFNINYTARKWSVGLIVENLFNTEWNETQFATESRLRTEAFPVEEIHFTPGTPFRLMGTLEYKF